MSQCGSDGRKWVEAAQARFAEIQRQAQHLLATTPPHLEHLRRLHAAEETASLSA